MQYVFYAILVYIAYQIIFKLVIPIYMASRKIKKGFREMHNRMQEQAGNVNENREHKEANSSYTAKKPAGDYIDFEEIK